MGEVRKYSRNKPWTKEEEEHLKNLCGTRTDGEIAKIMHRTKSSVKSKRLALGIPAFLELTDKLLLIQIAELVGIEQSIIGKTWFKKGLPYKKHGVYKMVSEEQLLKFMKEHPELWKASECDYYFFCRYQWFREKLESEKKGIDKGNHYRNRRNWTAREVSRMKMLLKRGLTHIEVAEELGRTLQAVDHKIMQLKRIRNE